MERLALSQLAAWESIANGWTVGAVIKAGSVHLVCGEDMATLFVLTDKHKRSYRFTAAQVQAATVAHLRDRHRELDPDVNHG